MASATSAPSRYHRSADSSTVQQYGVTKAPITTSHASTYPSLPTSQQQHVGIPAKEDSPSKPRIQSPRHDVDRRQRLDQHSAERAQYDQDAYNTAHRPQLSPTRGRSSRPRSPQRDDTDDDSNRCFGLRRKKPAFDQAQTPIMRPVQDPSHPSVTTQSPAQDSPYIKPGGGGIVPGTDAPQSAINTGDQSVHVEFDGVTIRMSVKPDTTAANLLQYASNRFPRPIDITAVALVEHYDKINIQRPLRRYERVWDVINSWDQDNANRLIIKSARETGTNPALLHSSHAPRERPPGLTIQLFHSQRPGKWSKAHITIKDDGQITAAKKITDKSPASICHLSDFDVYMPTPEQRSWIKPPKEHCIAIKSQQKTVFFESRENYIHFFSTSDKTDLVRLYLAAQSWRSWYLVQQLGAVSTSTANVSLASPHAATTQGPSDSLQNAPFQTTIAPSRRDPAQSPGVFANAPSHTVQSSSQMPARHVSVKASKAAQGSSRLSENEPLANIFTSSNDSASSRSRSQRHTSGNTPTTAPESSLNRSPSRRDAPKPLVDLTPSYPEPPQHQRKGRGYVPDDLGGGGLVEAATTRESAIQPPSATDWRNRTATLTNNAGSASSSAAISRSKSLAQRDRSPNTAAPTERTRSLAGQDHGQATFSKGGLLATAPDAQGNSTTGRGVKQSDNVAGPLLDMTGPSTFAPNSLLAKQK